MICYENNYCIVQDGGMKQYWVKFNVQSNGNIILPNNKSNAMQNIETRGDIYYQWVLSTINYVCLHKTYQKKHELLLKEFYKAFYCCRFCSF